ncbi:hypothetical protein [Microlunatus soli]|nr:hypothetical protein [Microlunatus soli]
MPLSRRSLLRLGVGTATGLAAAGVAGCAPGTDEPTPDPTCVSRSSLSGHRSLGDADLIYDISQNRNTFWFDDGFYGQLGRWLDDYRELTGAAKPDQVWTYGSWLDGGPDCDSWHDAGRAFDLSRLVRNGEVQVSARYDIWKDYAEDRRRRFRTRYWALAASLHLHFAYVLTYLYNPTHHNHIHIDNGRSGEQLSTFSTRSTAQVQAVQGMLNHIWDRPVEITGDFDRATAKAARSVLEQTGTDGGLDDGVDQWRAFLRATAARRIKRH